MDAVAWTRMEDGTAEDFVALGPIFAEHVATGLVPNLVSLLGMLRGPKLGYQIDRYDHSLQSGSRALRADERPDVVVAALLHDVADAFAPENHSQAAAALLEPYVDAETHWVVEHHGIFQGYYYFHHVGADRHERDRYRDKPHFDACARFCAEYDQNCFDPDYDTLPISAFLPLLDEVFGRTPKGWA